MTEKSNMILEWDHKELKQYGDIHYTYDTNHIRTQKKTKDKTIEYILDGTRILKEIHTYYPTQLESYIDEYSTIDTYREEIEYIYGQEGIIGFDHIKGNERKRYLYNKNILGDILEIYDEEKNLVGKYSYDGYGNQKIEVNIYDIANINPIRYRSYYYDSETNLYYLNSRYYDPETCRFISMDSIEYINPNTINRFNLYAYCNNNPIMYVDPSGHFAFFLLTMLIGLAIGTGVALYNDYKDDNFINGSIGVGGYVMPILAGVAIGAFAGMAISGALAGSFFASVKSVFTGAKMLYGMYKAVGIVGSGCMMLDNLSNAMYYTPHTFWSGGEVAKNSATEFSMLHGYTTLEMTYLGSYLESLKTYNETAWVIASYNFANQVPNGSLVYSFQNAIGIRMYGIWATVEYPTLISKAIQVLYKIVGN